MHLRHSLWAERGVWQGVLEHLSEEADNEYAMIDATIVRAAPAQCGGLAKRGGDEAIGHSRGGLSTKIHVTVDALGNQLDVHLTAIQIFELDGADVLLPKLRAP